MQGGPGGQRGWEVVWVDHTCPVSNREGFKFILEWVDLKTAMAGH